MSILGVIKKTNNEGYYSDGLGNRPSQLKINNNLREALIAAREKLVIYRAERGGVYTGGMEYAMLMNKIDDALNQ